MISWLRRIPRGHKRALTACALLAVCAFTALPGIVYAGTPPGPCHQGRDGEEWHDPVFPSGDPNGDYECRKPLPGFPGEGEWGWYKKFPAYTRHPADPTPARNGELALSGAGSLHADGDPVERSYTSVTGSFTVSARQHPTATTSATVYWGDGTSSSVTVPPGSGSVSQAISHEYEASWQPGQTRTYEASAVAPSGRSSNTVRTVVETC